MEYRYYNYLLEWYEATPDEWGDRVVGKTHFGDSFEESYSNALIRLQALGEAGQYTAYVGREEYDFEYDRYCEVEGSEMLAVQWTDGRADILNHGTVGKEVAQ